jgi:hypothetical protein
LSSKPTLNLSERWVKKGRKGKTRFFSVTSLGAKHWYWVVWPSLEELQTSRKPLLTLDEGYEHSKAEAVAHAITVAGENAEWIAAKYAKSYRRSKTVKRQNKDKQENTESPNSPVSLEFLYRDIRDTEGGNWRSFPHRVVSKTQNYVYVEQHPFSPGDLTGSWLDRSRPTYRLDRQMLENQGYAFIPVTAYLADTEQPIFLSTPHHTIWYGRQIPRCLKVLNLSWPCTIADVRKAYRGLVKQAHPDGGGSHEKFLELQEAYEQAVQMCGKGFSPGSGNS